MATATASAADLVLADAYSFPTPQRMREDGEFYVTVDPVPLFKEHYNTAYDVDFNRNVLARIVENCNRRIADTKDFATVAIRHVDEVHNEDPPVVGFGGPYVLGQFGKLRPKSTIFGYLRYYKKDWEAIKSHPRLSVEYWCHPDDPTDGYFDTISLLGAEAPELDLGIRFSREQQIAAASGQGGAIDRAKDWIKIPYSRMMQFDAAIGGTAATPAYPSGSNTFTPGSGDGKKKKDTILPFSKDGQPMMGQLDTDMMRQLIEALKPVITEAIAEQIGPGGKTVEPVEGADLAATDNLTNVDGKNAEGPAGAEQLPIQPDPTDAATERPMADDKDKDKFTAADEAAADKAIDEHGKDAKKAVMKFQKQNGSLLLQYEKAKADLATALGNNTTLESRVVELEKKANAAVAQGMVAMRFSKLKQLESEGYNFEAETEIEDCKPDVMNDQQFDRHLDKIKIHYQRVPLGVSAPMIYEPPQDRKAAPLQGDKAMSQRMKFSKEAQRRVLEARANGTRLELKDALDAVYKENSSVA